jgi:hypothetical protein
VKVSLLTVLPMNSVEINCDKDFWPSFITRHWKAFIVFVVGCIAALAGAVLVLFWFMETSTIGAMGTATIGEWSVAMIWFFLLYLIFWELVIIGIPAGIAFGVGWYIFWKQLSDQDKAMFKARDKKKHRGSSASGGFGLFMFIAFSIYLYLIGEINTPLGNHSYSFWVYSWFTALGWLLIIAGVPAALILILVYFTVWRKKE